MTKPVLVGASHADQAGDRAAVTGPVPHATVSTTEQENRMSDPVDQLNDLGAEWAQNLDQYASGELAAHQIQCVLCKKAPCACNGK